MVIGRLYYASFFENDNIPPGEILCHANTVNLTETCVATRYNGILRTHAVLKSVRPILSAP
jgi:hypothetical protein